MKRLSFVLALSLILLGTMCGDVLPSIHPVGYVDVNEQDEKDDHPWGGDQIGSDGTDGQKDYTESFAACITPVDFLVELIISKYQKKVITTERTRVRNFDNRRHSVSLFKHQTR